MADLAEHLKDLEARLADVPNSLAKTRTLAWIRKAKRDMEAEPK